MISGVSSAWFITSANSWLNSPTGFQLVNGKAINVDPFAAILNPSTPFETTHMILACYVATGFGAAAVYAVGLLRGKRDDYHRKGLLLGMLIGVSAIPFQIISGDFNARSIEVTQPAKYAAMEGVIQSGYGKPLYIGGIVDPASGQVHYAIQIPHGESLISHFDLNSYTKGLDAFPPSLQPPAAVDLAFESSHQPQPFFKGHLALEAGVRADDRRKFLTTCAMLPAAAQFPIRSSRKYNTVMV